MDVLYDIYYIKKDNKKTKTWLQCELCPRRPNRQRLE